MKHDPANWQQALAEWNRREAEERAAAEAARPRLVERIPAGWWQEAFANPPTTSERCGHACGEKQMLMLVAYDVADPRRLARVAKHCEDYGIRVQYSVFECRLDAGHFEQFWSELLDLVDDKEDRLVAYRICAECAKDVREAGVMESTTKCQQQDVYVF